MQVKKYHEKFLPPQIERHKDEERKSVHSNSELFLSQPPVETSS